MGTTSRSPHGPTGPRVEVIDIAAAIQAGITTLETAQVDYAVVGSVAASAWGVIRSTRDVDVVVAVQPEQLLAWLAAVDAAQFYVPTESARSAIRNGGSFNILHLVSGAKIDVFVPEPNDRLAGALLARRVRSEVFGVACWIASAEDVLLAKLRWRLTTRSERQWMDCGEIVAAVPLDREYLWANADAYEVRDDLRELLREAE